MSGYAATLRQSATTMPPPPLAQQFQGDVVQAAIEKAVAEKVEAFLTEERLTRCLNNLIEKKPA